MILWLSDSVDYYWEIAKLESWHWGVVIYNQIVTWTAFATIAMFLKYPILSDTCPIVVLRSLSLSPWGLAKPNQLRFDIEVCLRFQNLSLLSNLSIAEKKISWNISCLLSKITQFNQSTGPVVPLAMRRFTTLSSLKGKSWRRWAEEVSVTKRNCWT